MSLCIWILPGPSIQVAEAEVTASCKRLQAEILSSTHGLKVELFSARNIERFMLRYFSDQTERPGLEACFVALSCAAKRIRSEFARFFYCTHQETCFTQPHDHLRMECPHTHQRGLLERLA